LYVDEAAWSEVGRCASAFNNSVSYSAQYS
jgi:hypothetical protein